jgi:hypothetical protein
VATHRTSVEAFTVGEPASLGVKEIAENGNLGPFVSSLQGARGVSEVVEGTFICRRVDLERHAVGEHSAPGVLSGTRGKIDP